MTQMPATTTSNHHFHGVANPMRARSASSSGYHPAAQTMWKMANTKAHSAAAYATHGRRTISPVSIHSPPPRRATSQDRTHDRANRCRRHERREPFTPRKLTNSVAATENRQDRHGRADSRADLRAVQRVGPGRHIDSSHVVDAQLR